MIQLSVYFKTLNTKSRTFNAVLDPNEEYEIALDDLEFAFSKKELSYIQNTHNNNIWITDIAKNIKRNEYEVLIAILHMHKQGKKIKSIAFKRG